MPISNSMLFNIIKYRDKKKPIQALSHHSRLQKYWLWDCVCTKTTR